MNEKELKLLDQLIVEYELRAKYNLSQEDYLMFSMLLKARAHLSPEYEERILADERRTFAEWLFEVTTFDCGYCQLEYYCSKEGYKNCVGRLIAEYEKEQMNEN